MTGNLYCDERATHLTEDRGQHIRTIDFYWHWNEQSTRFGRKNKRIYWPMIATALSNLLNNVSILKKKYFKTTSNPHTPTTLNILCRFSFLLWSLFILQDSVRQIGFSTKIPAILPSHSFTRGQTHSGCVKSMEPPWSLWRHKKRTRFWVVWGSRAGLEPTNRMVSISGLMELKCRSQTGRPK